jgi:hypothetical protein
MFTLYAAHFARPGPEFHHTLSPQSVRRKSANGHRTASIAKHRQSVFSQVSAYFLGDSHPPPPRREQFELYYDI